MRRRRVRHGAATCCSRSASTSSSAGAACSTSASSAFYGIGAYTYALLRLGAVGLHLPTVVVVPLVVVIGAIVGFLLGLPSRRLDRRLPGDRDAVLLTDLPHGRDERRRHRRPQHHRRRQRDPQRRSVRICRPHSGGRARRRVRVSATCTSRSRSSRWSTWLCMRQPLAHRAGLALAARGPAGRRGDGHARQHAEADGLQLRRRGRGPHGHRVRRPQRQRLPADLLVSTPDNGLHHGHPGRAGQHGRRHGRRRRGQRAARVPARPGRRRASSSTSSG